MFFRRLKFGTIKTGGEGRVGALSDQWTRIEVTSAVDLMVLFIDVAAAVALIVLFIDVATGIIVAAAISVTMFVAVVVAVDNGILMISAAVL